MANPTTNYGWVMPNSADLVTDLPADFAVFGQGVDTSMQYLLGGTTGQVLSKTSATNMAFTWINNDQGDITGVTAGTGITVTSPTGPVPTVAIDTTVTVDKTTAQTLINKTLTSPALTTPTISTATTNGDILYGTGSGALARLGIGSSGQSLVVASGIPSWATPSAGALTLVKARTTFTSVADTGTTFDNVFSSTYRNYVIIIDQFSSSSAADARFQFRLAGATQSGSYYSGYFNVTWSGTTAGAGNSNTASMVLSTMAAGANISNYNLTYYNPNASGQNRKISWTGYSPQLQGGLFGGGHNDNSATSDGFILSASVGNITGAVTVYGLAVS